MRRLLQLGRQLSAGYTCETTAGDSNACQETFCGPSFDAAECIANFLDQAETACVVGCTAEFAAALECIVPAAPLCDYDEADCGTPIGLLDACCDTACFL